MRHLGATRCAAPNSAEQQKACPDVVLLDVWIRADYIGVGLPEVGDAKTIVWLF